MVFFRLESGFAALSVALFDFLLLVVDLSLASEEHGKQKDRSEEDEAPREFFQIEKEQDHDSEGDGEARFIDLGYFGNISVEGANADENGEGHEADQEELQVSEDVEHSGERDMELIL